MIKLKNTRNRMFSCDLEQEVAEIKTDIRTDLDAKTGSVGMRLCEFSTYKNLTILAKETSQSLPENILKNASVKGAVRSGWLKVIR